MADLTGNVTLRDLYYKLYELWQNHPELHDAFVFDGEGNPFSDEIEIDNGNIMIYFEQ